MKTQLTPSTRKGDMGSPLRRRPYLNATETLHSFTGHPVQRGITFAIRRVYHLLSLQVYMCAERALAGKNFGHIKMISVSEVQ